MHATRKKIRTKNLIDKKNLPKTKILSNQVVLYSIMYLLIDKIIENEFRNLKKLNFLYFRKIKCIK